MEREKIYVHRTENQNGLRDLEDDGECLESAQKERFTATSFTRGPLSVRRIEGHFQARLVSDTRLPGTLPQEWRLSHRQSEGRRGDAETQEAGNRVPSPRRTTGTPRMRRMETTRLQSNVTTRLSIGRRDLSKNVN